MRVLVDTTIWSLALRRRRGGLSSADQRLVYEWRALVLAERAVLAGPIRQELLSGIRNSTFFQITKDQLQYYEHLLISLDDYDQAAVFANVLHAAGLATSPMDLILCAIAHRWGTPILTTDRDFELYSRHIPLELHMIERA
jgi:predicted nucleic acid-binding protein